MATSPQDAIANIREDIERLANSDKTFKGKDAMVERKTRELNAIIDHFNTAEERIAKAERRADLAEQLAKRETDMIHRLVLWARLQGVHDGVGIVEHYSVERLDAAIDVRVAEFKKQPMPVFMLSGSIPLRPGEYAPWLDSNWCERQTAALNALFAAGMDNGLQQCDDAHTMRTRQLEFLRQVAA